MVVTRGYDEDYHRWEDLGNPGWGWSDMRNALKDHLSYFPDLYMLDNSRPLMTPMLRTLQNAGYAYNADPVFGERQSGITNRRYTLKYQGIDQATSMRQNTFTQYINPIISSLLNLEVCIIFTLVDIQTRVPGYPHQANGLNEISVIFLGLEFPCGEF